MSHAGAVQWSTLTSHNRTVLSLLLDATTRRAVNRSCFLSRATWRTPPNPWDTRSPLCVGRLWGSAPFSLVCALSSATSAETSASLFGCFIGTAAQSDSSLACVSGLWLFAFPDRSAGADAKEVSRFSCILFLDVPGVFDYAG